MYVVNDDLSIYCTRGDYCHIPVQHQFQAGDKVRFKAFRKKDCNTVVIQRDFTVETAADTFVISLTGTDTKIGEVISKPVDYWYEVELNPETNPQTIIGYDDEGAKVFKLFPEGKDVDAEDIEVVGTKTLQELVDYALSQALESGDFNGEDGYTPVKGVDYYTETEKTELVNEVTKKELPLCTNALKATASGEVVRVDDVSPFAHTASVLVRSKNLWTVDNLNANNISYDPETQITTISGAANATVYAFTKPIPRGTIVTIKATVISGVVTSNADGGLAFGGYNKISGSVASWQGYINIPKYKQEDITGKVFENTFKTTEDVTHLYVFCYAPTATIHQPLKLKIQYEIGETATEHSPHIDPATVTITRYGVDETDNLQTFIPEADGTCYIPSLSPTMTLRTNTANARIECEYNQDINKAMQMVYSGAILQATVE